MKRNILIIGAFAFAAFGLHSCLDYDDPGSEMGKDQVINDDEKFEGNIDLIDYKVQCSEESFKEASQALTTYFSMSNSAQHIMRGGKEEQPLPGAHAYQRQYSLGPDGYAGYMVVPHKDFMYGSLTSTYNVSDEFNNGPLYSYTAVKNCLMPLLHHPMVDSIPEMKAINLLFYCLSAQENADLSGPFTYLEDKQNSETPTQYNDLKTIYTGIVENIDTIVKCLQNYENRPDWYKAELKKLTDRYCKTTRDGLTGVNSGMKPYIALANSLKLRMALHIVKVEPQLAQQWAEEACDPANGGVVESVDEQMGCYPHISGFGMPLIEICNSWGDLVLCASLESLLHSLNHPYLNYIFKKNSNSFVYQRINEDTGELESVVTPANTVVCGLRAGTMVGDGQSAQNPLQGYSKVDANNISMCPLYYIKFSEVDFLRAEAALRGWNVGGTAQFFYERGIQNAYMDDPLMAMGGVYEQAMGEYMKLDKPLEYVNKDLSGGTEDWPSVTKIGVTWNEGDSQETKLEKIITQKYIALFPLSTEAWTELRRTGYPALFPVLNADDGDGTIVQGDIIRRIPWAETDPQKKAAIDATGIQALGGEDFQSTRLWWDVATPNF